MKISVGVVDYGMGNLHSVAKSLAFQGARVRVTDSRAKLAQSDLVVLPGVGSFGAAMKALAKKRLDDFIWKWIQSDRPYLGICLGFQMLFEESQESPRVPGLGVFKGDVVRFRFSGRQQFRLPVPHMGWNTAEAGGPTKNPYFRGIRPLDRFYFVHSYYPAPNEEGLIQTKTRYGATFCSSVARGRLFASQFHPEKSGAVGFKLLKNILAVSMT